MHRCPDVAGRQLVNEAVAIDREGVETQAYDIEMPRMLYLRTRDRQLERRLVGEGSVVLIDNCRAPLLEPRQFAQLPETERRLNVRHVVLEAGQEHLVIPAAALGVALPGIAAHPVQANDAGLGEKLRCRGEHPTFSGCKVLGRVEAERGGIASESDGTAAIAGGQGMRR